MATGPATGPTSTPTTPVSVLVREMAERSPAEPGVEAIGTFINLYVRDDVAPSTPQRRRLPPTPQDTPPSKRARLRTLKGKSPSSTPSKSREVGRESRSKKKRALPGSSDPLNLNSDNRLKFYEDKEGYPYQCPICMRRFGTQGGEKNLKKHIKWEVDLWHYLFYDVDGVGRPELEDVKYHGCGICSEHAAWGSKEELLEHVIDRHCAHKRAGIQSQDASRAVETNTPSPPLPAKMTWDFSTVFESLLKDQRLKIEAYRPSKHGDFVVTFLWPRTGDTLRIFGELQQGSWRTKDEIALGEFVEEACALATHRIYSSRGNVSRNGSQGTALSRSQSS